MVMLEGNAISISLDGLIFVLLYVISIITDYTAVLDWRLAAVFFFQFVVASPLRRVSLIIQATGLFCSVA